MSLILAASERRVPGDRCTITVGSAPCGKQSMPGPPPFPICFRHAAEMKEFLERAAAVASNRDLFREYARWRRPKRAPIEPVVYYLRLGGLIKIGYTRRRVEERLSDYPPAAELLATELGDAKLERQRHREFNCYLQFGKEWFDEGPELAAHIRELRSVAVESGTRVAGQPDFGA